MTRLTDRADMAKKNATQVKKITGKINESLRPGEEFDNDLLSCMNQLKQVPGQVSRWKKYAALCGADVALALTRTHFPRLKDEDLQVVGSGNPAGKDFTVHMPAFMETASSITSFIDLDTFVEPVGVPDTPEEKLEKEEEEENE